MAQQTAVEKFIKSLIERDRLINPNSFSIQIYFEGNKDLIEQAKEMEKQQHEKINKFLDVEKVLGISDLKTIERIQWYYNNYFNETYGK
jgi:ferritin